MTVVSIIEKAGIALSDHQSQQFEVFHRSLLAANAESNLVGPMDQLEGFVAKHYIDCLKVADQIDGPRSLLDLGSGAGFPGIPIKIIRPDLEVILAEPRKKRVAFLKQMIRDLQLSKTGIFSRTVTSAGIGKSMDAVISRAVESIPETLNRIYSTLNEHGKVYFMKGPDVDKELSNWQDDRYDLTGDIAYCLPFIKHQRRLLTFRKKS